MSLCSARLTSAPGQLPGELTLTTASNSSFNLTEPFPKGSQTSLQMPHPSRRQGATSLKVQVPRCQLGIPVPFCHLPPGLVLLVTRMFQSMLATEVGFMGSVQNQGCLASLGSLSHGSSSRSSKTWVSTLGT